MCRSQRLREGQNQEVAKVHHLVISTVIKVMCRKHDYACSKTFILYMSLLQVYHQKLMF